MPLSRFMSDPVALVCVRGSDPDDDSARRWKRRASAAHGPRVGAVLATGPARAPRRFAGLPRGLLLLLVGGVGWACATGALAHSGGSAFSRRIGAGCEEIEPCLSLEEEAERRLDACALFCDREVVQLGTARQLRFRAEERRAVREHYRERDRAEGAERQRERDERQEEWQREQAARAAEAARDQQHRLELERLRQEHIDRRLADERQRRVSYLAALGAEGRALRLERCLKKGRERCDALTLDLLDAAGDEAERRKLAEANEGLVHPPPKPEAVGASSAGVGESASVVTSSGARAPAEAPASTDATTIPST